MTVALAGSAAGGAMPVTGGDGAVSAAANHQDAVAGHWPRSAKYVRTQGRYSPGDGGGALWRRVSAVPSHPGRFQSAEGTWWEIAEDELSPLMFGAVADGDADDSAALAAAEASARALRVPLKVNRPLRVRSELSLNSDIQFLSGGMLKPSRGVRLRLKGAILAGASQIFDLSEGGEVILPDELGEVWAAWWGLDERRVDNEVPLQQAINALEAYWWDRTTPLAHSGGAVRLHRGVFRVSGPIVQRNLVRLVGVARNYSRLLAHAATWSGQRMLLCQNRSASSIMSGVSRSNPAEVTSEAHGLAEGAVVQVTGVVGMRELNGGEYTVGRVTANTYQLSGIDSSSFEPYESGGVAVQHISQFGVRCEEVTLNAGDIDGIEEVVLAESWNEQCGLRNCLILGFRHTGIKVRKGYGGSSLTSVANTEVSGSTAEGTVGIDVDIDFVTGFHDLLLSEVTVTGCSVAVAVNNSVRVVAGGVFIEDAETGVQLGSRARLTGSALKAQRGTGSLIGLRADWSGRIDALSCAQGPAVRLLQDHRAGKEDYRLYDGEFLPGTVNYPLDGMPVFGGRIVGGASPDKRDVRQLSGIRRSGPGSYHCTLAHFFSLGNAENYYGHAWAEGVADDGVTCSLTPKTATAFDIVCRDRTGRPVDVEILNFLIHHKL